MGLLIRTAWMAATGIVWLSLQAPLVHGQAHAIQAYELPPPGPALARPTPAYPTTGYPATDYAATPLPAAPLLAPPAEAVVPLPPPPPAPTPAESLPIPPPADPPVEPPAAPAEPVESSAIAPADGAAAVDPALLADPEVHAVHWYQPTTWFGPTPWETGFELGINGSTGTSETLSVRTGGYLKRKSDFQKLDLSLYHNKTSSDGADTQNNAILKARNDWLMGGKSPWSLFAMTQVFYDEFQAFDLNVNVNGGLGYQFFDDDWVKLGVSFGAGASREFGGVDDEWTPEAQLGFDFEQKISETQKFYANVDYFPEWEDFGSYRVVSDMGVEIQLSYPSNVSLKLSATDRYDSMPGGVSPHNTNYSVLLLWKR